MPGAAVTAAHPASPAVGVFGKIPSRGDFVAAELSLGFIQVWDGWLQQVLPDSERMLGEAWSELWHAAPAWRFALPPRHSSRQPVLGLWMPSVDRVGRPFPLTLAAEGAGRGDDFLDAAERIARDTIALALGPEDLLARLREAPAPEAATDASGEPARWWRAGKPDIALDRLPDGAAFARMLQP